jgi:colicin import membrane protein
VSELAIIEIVPDMAPSIYVENGLEKFLDQIRESVKEVPDLSTAKGRARIASLAAQVSRSKTAVEKPGRDYLRHLKEAVKPAEAELRRFVSACDEMRDEVRRPLTEWEAEQERIKAEEAMNAMHVEALEMNIKFDQELAAKFEADHEMALLMNDAFDREVAEKKAEAERQRIAHEEELKRQAEEKSKREAEEKIERERAESARREAELKFKAEQAERDRIATEQKAEAEKKEAADRAEREKQEAIAAEQRKAQEEADRIKREAEAKEAARLAEEKRIADEAAARAADVEHRRAINAAAVQSLIDQGIPEDWAKACVVAIARGKVPATTINY